MIVGNYLGDPRSELVATLSAFLGTERAEAIVSNLEATTEEAASSAVKPMVIGAIGLGAVGAALGAMAFFRRRS